MSYLFALIAALMLFTQATQAQQLPDVAIKDHAEVFGTSATPQSEKYNLKLGNVKTNISGTFEAEYNDNINEVTTGKVSDEIVRFGIESKSVWPITELNTLTLDLNAGYRFYVNHSGLDSNHNFLDINPGSELAFKWWIKDFSFKLYDQAQFTLTPADTRVFNTATSSVSSGIINLGELQNRAGIEGLWDLNQIKVYGGYARDDVRTDHATFQSLDRTAHTFYISPLALLTPDFSAGLLSSYTQNYYKTNFQSNGSYWSFGPTFYWQATANTNAAFNVYWKKFESDNNGTNGDTSNTSTVDGSFKVTNDVNSYFNHSLQIARDTQLGTVTNTTTVDSIYYLPVYQLTENLALKGRLGYELGKDSSGPNAEKYIRRVIGIGAGYTWSEKLKTELDYNYTINTSDIPQRPFDQNQVIFSANYDF